MCRSLLHSEGSGQKVFGIGLKDIKLIVMPEVVITAPKKRIQEVKETVELLEAKDIA